MITASFLAGQVSPSLAAIMLKSSIGNKGLYKGVSCGAHGNKNKKMKK